MTCWTDTLFEAVEGAIRNGASPREVIVELETCWLEALDDHKRDVRRAFQKILKETPS